jgi:hypothetical protein
MRVFQNMSKCDTLIKDACNFSLSGNDSSDVSECNAVMGDFRKGADACANSTNNCTCWSNMVKIIPKVKKCNIGKFKFPISIESNNSF